MRHNNILRRHHRLLGVAAAGLSIAGLAACGSGGSGATSAGGRPSAGTSASGAVLRTSTISAGKVLVDRTGRTIYDFAGDKGSKSTCTSGACAANWHAVKAPASVPATVAGSSAKLGATTWPDGTRQLTVSGHPVYTYVGDTAPGQANGQGKVLNGGLWTVVAPSGASITGSSSASSAAPGKGYGY